MTVTTCRTSPPTTSSRKGGEEALRRYFEPYARLAATRSRSRRSRTVETDGRLPSGQPLHAAIEYVDSRTDGYASYFMVNCAHPSHFEAVLEPGSPWTDRVMGLRANASRLSHAELDEAEELDTGNPEELALE